jgi:hypothetical protein
MDARMRPVRETTMKVRCWVSYGAVAAITVAAAGVLAACEPTGVSSSIAAPEWSFAVEASQVQGAQGEMGPMDAARSPHAADRTI